MDFLLVGIAALSLILAIGMGLILFKVLQDERQRSAARVAFLNAAAAETELPLAPALDEPAFAASDEPAFAAGPVVSRSELFIRADAPSPWPRRAAVAAALAATVAIAGYVLLPSRAAAPAPAAAAMPLELLALRHTQQGNTLTVSGTVRNPRAGAPQSQVFATAILFAADGSFLTSGRAALDFTALAPGDESPFQVAVPVNGTVARYRVGFRAADGSVIAHVDRRVDVTSVAQQGQVSGSMPWAH
jgi:hypothetical protein